MMDTNTKTRWKCTFPLTIGIGGVVLLVGVLGGWGGFAKIDGAIIASGQIQVASNRQVVQHQDGGVVDDIMVQDGDMVEAGEVVLKLDTTFAQSELSITEGQLFEMLVRRQRLVAERDNLEAMEVTPELEKLMANSPDVRELYQGQERLFQARRNSLATALEQLAEQSNQMERQIVGIRAEQSALNAQLKLIKEERIDAETLWKKGLKTKAQLNQLKREEVGLRGQIGQLTSRVAVLRGQMAETKLKALQYNSSRREKAIEELRDTQTRISNMREKRLSLSERLARTEIRAPVRGKVFGSTVFALQSVVRPGQEIMYIVPQDQPLIASTRAQLVDVDKLYIGQETRLVFSALDVNELPDIYGEVTQISADALTDQNTGESFFQIEITPNEDSLGLLGDQQIVPGMPVEAFINTGERTALSYIVKPFSDYFSKAFREG